ASRAGRGAFLALRRLAPAKKNHRHDRWFFTSRRKNYTRLIFSSILKTPLGALTNKRLKDLPRQRRSRVLRRTRLRSAMMISGKVRWCPNPPDVPVFAEYTTDSEGHRLVAEIGITQHFSLKSRH